MRGARILVLDEPTATLTPREADGLFRALRSMAAKGMGVIFISHKLGEVLEITTRITVMRHGRVVAERANDGSLSKPELARLMCGRDLVPPEKPPMTVGRAAPDARPRLDQCAGGRRCRTYRSRCMRARSSASPASPATASVSLRTSSPACSQPERGTMRVAGEVVVDASPKRMQALKVGRVPEDRLTTGMIGALPLVGIHGAAVGR